MKSYVDGYQQQDGLESRKLLSNMAILGISKKDIYIYVKVQGCQCSLCGLLVALMLGVGVFF